MAKRNLLSLLFGSREAKNTTQMQLLSGETAQWNSYTRVYQSDIARKAIDRIASQAAKMQPVHIKTASDGTKTPKQSDVLRLLARQPNPYMSGYDFLYKIVTLLYVDNNVFVLPVRELGQVTAFYPISAGSTELLEDAQKNIWVRFTFRDGKVFTLLYTDLIHLRRFFSQNDIAGDTDQRALLHSINVAQTALDGVENAIKISSRVLGIYKFPVAMKAEDKDKQLRELADYLGKAAEHGGFIPADLKGEVQPLSLDPKMAQKPLIDSLTSRVYSYYGVSDAIVNGDYSEQQFNAFYETVLEPLAIQMSQAFSNALFGAKSRDQIFFETSYLFYTSWPTKLAMIKDLTPLGHLSINEGRELLGLPPVEGGERRVQTLNVVNQTKVDDYQGVPGKGGESDEPKQEGDPDGGASSADATGGKQ